MCIPKRYRWENKQKQICFEKIFPNSVHLFPKAKAGDFSFGEITTITGNRLEKSLMDSFSRLAIVKLVISSYVNSCMGT